MLKNVRKFFAYNTGGYHDLHYWSARNTWRVEPLFSLRMTPLLG